MLWKKIRVRRRGDRGFALTEALVAVSLAAVTATGIATGMSSANRGVATSRTTTAAISFARAALEQARGFGHAYLANPSGDLATDPLVSGGQMDPDGNGPLIPEAILEDADASVDTYNTWSHENTTYSSTTYVTDAGSNLKRITIIVNWTQGGAARTTSVSSLVARSASPYSAAADALHSSTSGHSVSARAKRGGGTQSESAAAISPLPGWTFTGASSTASTVPGVSNHAETQLSSATITLTGLTIGVSGMTVTSDAQPGSAITSSITGTITINGTPFVNPVKGTKITVGNYEIVLGDTTEDADGSESLSFAHIKNGTSEDYRIGWTWVSPVRPW